MTSSELKRWWKVAQRRTIHPSDRLRTLGIAVFGSLLWILNCVPIQTPEYLCSATAVVSQERLHELSALSRSRDTGSEMIRWIDYQSQQASGAIDRGLQGDLRVVRLRVGLKNSMPPRQVELELERLTRATQTSVERQPIERRLRNERWKLQVAEHALTRFRLDQEREQLAVAETDPVLVTDEEDSRPFRLVSQSKPMTRSEVSSNVPTLASMSAAVEGCRQGVLIAQQELEQLQVRTSGTIAMTGAPRLSAHPGMVSWSRILTVMGLGTVFLALYSGWGYGWRVQKIFAVVPLPMSQLNHFRVRLARRLKANTRSQHAQVAAISRSLGLIYLGSIAIPSRLTEELEASEPGSFPRARGEATQSRSTPTSETEPTGWTFSDPRLLQMRLGRLALFSDGMLALWVGAFVLRYLCDHVWRELLFRAPLAAFSSVLLGI